ncbi:MAG: universal stress protein [Deltaproteobacteria bacterium]|nr:universal stress protein [Deltaproteobacteria bacterium]
MKIMFCHDGSELSQQALEKTIGFFGKERPEIILISVAEWPQGGGAADQSAFSGGWRSEHHSVLMKAARRVSKLGYDVDAILAVGDARKMILETVASKNPDILVAAASGALDARSPESVSAYLISHAPCPVLVFH